MSDDGAADLPPQSRGNTHGHLVPVNDDTAPRALAPRHAADLESSGLSEATIASAGIYSGAKSAPIADVLGWGWRNGGGMVLPFRDYDSNREILSRVKPDRPRVRSRGAKKRVIKYEQPPNSGAVPYFGPRCIREQRLHDTSRSVVWVEGEKKTLLLDQLGYAAIGITGCHTWNDADKHRDGDGLTWAKAIRKYAERFVRDRHHTICFDSDTFSNDNVMLALRRLAGLLLDGGAASVRCVRVPPDTNDRDRGVGIDDFFVDHGRDETLTRTLITSAELIAPGEAVTPIPPKDPLLKLGALAWLRGAKLGSDLRLPPGFEIRRDRSLWADPPSDKPDADQRELMRLIVLPTQMIDALDGDEQRLELAYYARGKWERAIVDRKACRDARRALAELPPGVAIDSNNATLVVLWLGEYLRHNEHRMGTQRFVSKCGWQTVDDEQCFLLDAAITRDGAATTIVADDSGDRSDILAALRPRGSHEQHVDALRRAFDEDPLAAVAILGALAAPLLAPLGAPNFAINFHGDSSKGKTSIVKIGSSVFGNPSSEQWIGSWNATPVGMELRAATLSDLPLCFDEVGAGDPRMVERAIYMLINGAGKLRGAPTVSVRKTPFWRTIVLSTGEHELVDDRATTGAQIRVLQFRVSGFGNLDGAGVDALREACEKHHGHVGRRWIEALVAIEDWQPYIALFDKAKKQFRAHEPGALMQRQAVYYALLATAEHLAHTTLGFGRAGGATVRELFADIDRRREVRTASERAIEIMSQWIASEPKTFPELDFNASGGLTARTAKNIARINGVRYKKHVCFLPNELRARLDLDGISSAEVLAAWRDRGWLDVDGKHLAKKIRWDGKRVRVIAVSCEILGIDVVENAAQTSADFGE